MTLDEESLRFTETAQERLIELEHETDLVYALVAQPEVLGDLAQRAAGGMEATETVVELHAREIGLVLELDQPLLGGLGKPEALLV